MKNAAWKLFLAVAMASLVPSSARAQSKAGKICVWADSEDLGVLIPTQPGGSVNSIAGSEVQLIRLLVVKGLRADKSNNVVDPCPQDGQNIELDVIIGQFLGAYVASVSVVIQGGKDGPIHVTSSVVAAKTDELLASDITLMYASFKLNAALGTVK
jgi:hypothetical protein